MRRKDIKENPDLRLPQFDERYIYKKMGDVVKKTTRPLKMEDESEYQLVTVKRGYGGVVSRGVFKGKEILVKSQFLLKNKDFLISKRQICHNACGIVPAHLDGAIVSNEYTVFTPKNGLDINYFNYFCCMPIISHTFFLSSIGVHIEKMLFKVDDWLKWEFPFPSLPEQQKIASFLSAVDKKIEQLTRKKELLEQYKKGVMQKIFSQEIRFKDDNGKDYPDWDRVELGDILTYEQPTKYLVSKTEYNDEYKTPVLTAGKTFILGHTDEKTGIYEDNLPVIIFDDFTTAFQFVDFKFKAKSSAMKILIPKTEAVNTKFIYESMKGLKFPLGEHKRYWISEYQYMKIDYPCEDEQQKIACFLSSIDKKISSVLIQLIQTKNFKKGLLQQMFV